MALQHFIVVNDTETGEWFIDHDLMLDYFDEGQLWSDDYESGWKTFHQMNAAEKDLARALNRQLADLLQNVGQGE